VGFPTILAGTPKSTDSVSHPGNGTAKFGGTNYPDSNHSLDYFNQIDQCKSDIDPGTVGTITDYPSKEVYKDVDHQKTTTALLPGTISEDYTHYATTRPNTSWETDWSLTGYHYWDNVVPRQAHLDLAMDLLDVLDEGSSGLDLELAWSRVTLGTQQSSFNLPQFAGELGEMRHLAAVPLKKLAKLGRSKNKLAALKGAISKLTNSLRKPPSLKQLIRGAAGADLSYQFVIKPLLADFEAMSKYQSHWNHQSAYIKEGRTLVAHGSAVHTDETEDDSTYHRNIGTYDCFVKPKAAYSRVTTATVIYQLGPSFDGPSQLKALGFNMPFSVAYELMPWSFAIDYAINLGDIIQGIERQFNNLFVPANIIASGTSVKTTSTAHVFMQPRCPYFADEGNWTGGGSAEYESTSYTRTKGLGHLGLIPRLEFKLPSARQALNLLDIGILKSLR
jgi:hypothetical protein